jgi:hypothetical protein
MSLVTNVILCCGLRDKHLVSSLPIDFSDIGKHFGGPKNCEAGVFGCAANYLQYEQLIDAVHALEWEQPLELQVIIKDQEDQRFSFLTGI